MPLHYKRPYRVFELNPSGQETYVQKGFRDDHEFDTRSPLTKTVPTVGGWRNPTSYSRVVETGNLYTYDYHMRATHVDRHIDGYDGANDAGGSWYYPVPAFPQSLRDRAVTKALERLKAQKVNYSVALGERTQTANLVYDNLVRLAGMVTDTRRAARRLLRDPFSLWLELQYGWKPLLSDVHGTMEALAARELVRPAVVTVKGRVSEFEEYMSATSSGYSPAFQVDRFVRRRNSCMVRLDYTEKNNPTLMQMSQLGFTNPLELAWELLPFSFVVDWFYPIGQYFHVLDAALGYDFKAGSRSEITRQNYKPIGRSMDPYWKPYYTQARASCYGKARQVRFTRSVYSASPLPKPPGLKKGTSGIHVANGIALLVNAFTKKVSVR